MFGKIHKPYFLSFLLVVILVIVLASACNSEPAPSDLESPVSISNNENKNTNGQPTITEPPTDVSPPADASPTSPTIPFANLSSSGPWIAFPAQEALWVFNTDGSGIIPLVNYNTQSGLVEVARIFPAPQGGRVAVLVIEYTGGFTHPHILIVQIPSGWVEANIPLLPTDWDYLKFTTREEKEAAEQLYAAVGVWNDPVWSHDGTMLAFNAAKDGPTSDLYVYNTTDSSTLRLTSGSTESIDPFWTITDSHIVHGAVSSLNYGYSGAGYDYLHVWAARPDGSGVNKVFDHDFYGYENFLGWTGYLSYLGESWENWCYSFNLRNIDINEGELEVLYEGHYTERAFADNYEKFLFAISNEVFSRQDCIQGYQPGVYMMDTSTGNSFNVPEIPADDVTSIVWQERAGLFFALTGQEMMYSITPSGSVEEFQAPKDAWEAPVFNLEGTQWAYANPYKDVLAIGGLDGEFIELDMVEPSNPIWSPDSEWLFFFADHEDGPTLYAAPAPDYNPIVVESGILYGNYNDAPVLVNP